MTPEEARELLDGTTPGPWEPHQKHHKVLVNNRQQFAVCAMPGDEPEDYANFNLIAAAPDMAATIAGMSAEYAIETQRADGTWRMATPWKPYNPLHRGDTLDADERLIRRYVTKPEVIE